MTNVDDYAGSAQALAATTLRNVVLIIIIIIIITTIIIIQLRNVLGTRTLGDILSDRVKIAQEMHVSL